MTDRCGQDLPDRDLRRVLRDIGQHPLRFTADWNWKAAAFSAVLRAGMFLLFNLRAGHRAALRAGAVEMVYATAAAGLAGAFTQRVRAARPQWLTALLVWLAVPALLLVLQAAVHWGMGTPRLKAGLLASFLFAALVSGFNWFAMGRGAFVTGEGRSLWRDLAMVPRLLWQFLLAPWKGHTHWN